MTLRKNARALPPAIFWMSVSEYARYLDTRQEGLFCRDNMHRNSVQ